MTGTELSNPTIGGLLAYCDWLKAKGYQGDNAIEAWKTAIKKVFAAVEPEKYESISLEGLDLDDYVRRFRRLAGADYKAETINVYAGRIRNAIEAQEHYRKTGRPPSFRKPTRRAKQRQASAPAAKSHAGTSDKQELVSGGDATGNLVRFPFPLRSGQLAELRLPARLDKSDADRLSAFLRALQQEEQPQLPERAGEESKAA